ncbi:MAG: hypothetical protein J6Y54_01285, partial [Lentisphaeria bacterium]|nr:hypothetical protein [Lentisphaeria bacterium]
DAYKASKSYLTLVDATMRGNTAELGGALLNDGVLTVSGGELSGNEAEDGKGGALYNTGSASFSMANFIDNTALYGGAIYQNGDVEINDAYIASNTAIYGGALYANISGSTIISAVSFEGNVANYDEDYDLGGMGGAVYVAGAATVTVTDTIFEGNVAEVNPDNEWDGGCGGAVINYGKLTVTSGAFMGNSAYYGGALYNQVPYPAVGESDGTMTVVNAAFTDNTAAWGGGAICNCWGELVVSGGNYSGNKVTGKDDMNVGGGAIANWSDATITGASFTSNTVVTGKGGAITNTGTTLTVTDAFFTGNTADEGGAIWNKTEYGGSPAVSLSNCMFTGNTAELGGALLNDGTAELVNCTFATATDTIRNDSVITVSGENTFAGAVVNSATGSFRVSLANSTVDSAAVVGGWSNLSGGAISIIAPTDLEYGTYRIASGVGAWSGDIALTVGAEDTGGKFTLAGGSVAPGVISYGYADYELAADSEGNMTLDIKAPAVQAQAGALGPDAARENGDRAGTWNSSTGVTSGAVILVPDNMPDGRRAYLVIDSGYDGGSSDDGTVLYGASGTSFEHGTVNILARGGSLRNLAAGAAATGKVAAVELTFQGTALTGVGYAGGFGSVTGSTETLISDGTFAKDFYAGALANYKNTDVATTVGDVSLTVEDGTFSGTLYGASAVKASVAGAHTAGDVTVKLAGGTAEKSDFCCFAGGYATGNAADAAVYTVGKIGVDVTGGSWGEAHGGRGIFGGAFASGVKAAASDVTISVSGGTMGNVYGGGWAQKGGTSIVGNVNITISGDAQVVNVYGGGSHSISAGSENSTTQAANVTITVSGGSVTGGIYARGQLDGDVVTGSADVIFTGSKDYGCSVYGYTYVGGTASDATLRFTAYSGTLAGRIGGFAGVTFDGNTEMTLSAAKSAVSNTEWIFDVAARDAGMSGTAMLDWNAADFTGDNITLKLGTTAPTEWTLIDAASNTAYDKFGVDGIAAELDLDQQIAGTGTAYDGWGFTVEDSALKFKQLA